MDIRILCCIGSLLLATNSAYSAEIKRWVDEDGRVHFGDCAPNGVDNVLVTPEIITIAPSSNNSLKKIMRPGELRMIKNYEKRGKRLIKAKRKALKQAKLDKKRLAKAEKKCDYHQRKSEQLKRKLRNGCKPSERIKVKEKIAKHNKEIKEYCN